MKKNIITSCLVVVITSTSFGIYGNAFEVLHKKNLSNLDLILTEGLGLGASDYDVTNIIDSVLNGESKGATGNIPVEPLDDTHDLVSEAYYELPDFYADFDMSNLAYSSQLKNSSLSNFTTEAIRSVIDYNFSLSQKRDLNNGCATYAATSLYNYFNNVSNNQLLSISSTALKEKDRASHTLSAAEYSTTPVKYFDSDVDTILATIFYSQFKTNNYVSDIYDYDDVFDYLVKYITYGDLSKVIDLMNGYNVNVFVNGIIQLFIGYRNNVIKSHESIRKFISSITHDDEVLNLSYIPRSKAIGLVTLLAIIIHNSLVEAYMIVCKGIAEIILKEAPSRLADMKLGGTHPKLFRDNISKLVDNLPNKYHIYVSENILDEYHPWDTIKNNIENGVPLTAFTSGETINEGWAYIDSSSGVDNASFSEYYNGINKHKTVKAVLESGLSRLHAMTVYGYIEREWRNKNGLSFISEKYLIAASDWGRRIYLPFSLKEFEDRVTPAKLSVRFSGGTNDFGAVDKTLKVVEEGFFSDIRAYSIDPSFYIESHASDSAKTKMNNQLRAAAISIINEFLLRKMYYGWNGNELISYINEVAQNYLTHEEKTQLLVRHVRIYHSETGRIPDGLEWCIPVQRENTIFELQSYSLAPESNSINLVPKGTIRDNFSLLAKNGCVSDDYFDKDIEILSKLSINELMSLAVSAENSTNPDLHIRNFLEKKGISYLMLNGSSNEVVVEKRPAIQKLKG